MTPTAKLRWLEREEFVPFPGPAQVRYAQKVRVLQQWWEPDLFTLHTSGEWRDIPVEEA